MSMPKAAAKKRRPGRRQERSDESSHAAPPPPMASLPSEMGFEIGQGRSDVLTYWRTLTKEEKCDLIALDDAELADAVALVGQRFPQFDGLATTIDTATTQVIQAMVLHSMETSDGKLILDDISVEKISLLLALERKIFFGVVAKDMHRKAAIAMFYFVWVSSWPWLGGGAYLLVLSSNLTPCMLLRDATCRGLDAFFIHDKDPMQVEWHFNSYLTALLLLYTSKGTHVSAYVVIAILLAIPYGISALKSALAKGAADRAALEKITAATSLLNKLILVYYSWSSYSSLILVAVLFFDVAALSIAGVAFIGVSYAVKTASQLVVRLVPARYINAYESWKLRSKWNAFAVSLLPLVLAALVVWGSWDWSSPYGGFVRVVTALALTQVVPAGLFTILAQLVFLAIALPLRLIQSVLVFLGIKPAMPAPSDSASSDSPNAFD
ncbi:hypothetical protein ACHHYP_04676 [Achlya hypogyna]|uniref:Transmembrane protein n=1 Tax=Achlya hypogyna TaxID=1202772 RepID=A0A1V9Z0A6_ACHHY|nr:hypothetical protein ACHHYP_04676 [Achlya hypogyna]